MYNDELQEYARSVLQQESLLTVLCGNLAIKIDVMLTYGKNMLVAVIRLL